MPRIVRIAAAQLGPSGSKRENVERMCRLLDRAAADGARLVGFPELSLTPYFPIENTRDYEHYFEPLESPYLAQVTARAKARGIAVIVPFAERDSIRYFNSCLVTNTDGAVVGRYRKVHIPGAFPLPGQGALVFEKLYFTPGDLGYPVIDLGFVKVGVQICYERNFPEGYRILALKGADVIYTPTNLMRIGQVWTPDTWELVLRARAYENGCFVVGVNKAGHEGNLDYVGDSIVLSPKDGSVIARTSSDGDELLVVPIDLDDVVEARKRLPFMRDRQPWTYGPLVQ
jgi:predicted amidohydrolase